MNKEILGQIDRVYKETSRLTYKTIEQCLADFESELKVISKRFGIDNFEAFFLLSIILNNVEYKNCRLEDIADKMEISKFEVLKNIEKLFSLQAKKLIEISKPKETEFNNHRYSHLSEFPIGILNQVFRISHEIEYQLFG
ncbi:MAG TPA: hypothetical protein DD740_08395 [Chryseobacterium sp.]|nr:hypothetical protein HER18_06770 [Chryseobacterium sp. NEB161]HBR12207.1 hypothetical protein [Chryseobacterium sp.]